MTKETAVGHRPGDQQGNIALHSAKCEDRVDTVLFDDLGKMIHKDRRGKTLVVGLTKD